MSFPIAADRVAQRLLDLTRGCTFDDFIFTPQRSIVVSRDPARIDLTCQLTRRITLKRPIVSANMDTVTRAPMAIVQAEEGGIGIIDRGFRPGDIQPQVREVEIVKRTQHGVIGDPYSIGPGAQLSEAELLEFCRGHLAKFKLPRAVVFGELPKTSTGKIQKFVLRERAKSTSAIDT